MKGGHDATKRGKEHTRGEKKKGHGKGTNETSREESNSQGHSCGEELKKMHRGPTRKSKGGNQEWDRKTRYCSQ